MVRSIKGTFKTIGIILCGLAAIILFTLTISAPAMGGENGLTILTVCSAIISITLIVFGVVKKKKSLVVITSVISVIYALMYIGVLNDEPYVIRRCFNNTALHKLVLPKEVKMEHFGIFGVGYHNHPVTWQMVPCETDNLVVYIEKDCTAWDYFKQKNIQIFGEPVDYNFAVRLVEDEFVTGAKNAAKSNTKVAKKKKNFFEKFFGNKHNS